MDKELKVEGAGDLIRQCRKERGVSLEQLASRLGWDAGRLSLYENNKRGLSTEHADAIAVALGMRPEEFALRWLKLKYPALSDDQPKISRILDNLVEQVGRLK